MKKQKQEKEVPSFVDLEAEDESSTDILSDQVESEDIDGVSSTHIERKPRDWQKFTDDLAKKYGDNEIESKEKSSEEEDEDEDLDEVVEEVKKIPQYLLLPNARSPRLWIIRVMRGKERDICLRIMHNLQPENAIISIIAKPDLLGYIYIESFTKQAVVDALQTVRFVNRTKISPVPLNEMIDVMTIKSVKDIKNGSFVRVKKGKYKNDVAQIINCLNSEMVRIRIVPRLNNIQKLFDENSMDEKLIQTKIIDRKKAFVYKREFYMDGFLEKDVLINSLYFDVDVSFDEARVFEKKRKFNINEKVRVRRGDLINMIGLIKNIERNEIEIEVSGELFRMNIEDVEKSYQEGDEISFNGRNGVIVKNEGNIIKFIFTDTFGEMGSADLDEIEPPVTQKKFEIVKNLNISRTKRDPYLNHSVQILKGDFKGHFGVVKDVFKDSCRILMDSNLKFVNVDREDVILRESYSGTHAEDKQTDVNTQMLDHNQSFRFDKTPNYRQDTGKTPSYRKDFGKTPSYRRDMGKTPSYKNEYGKTPGYKNEYGKTPGYQNEYGKTPGYHGEVRKVNNYRAETGRTPRYKNEYGRIQGYRDETGRTPGYHNETGKTPSYKKDSHDYTKNNIQLYNNDSSELEYSVTKNTQDNDSMTNQKGSNTLKQPDDDLGNIYVKVNGKERVLTEIRNNKFIVDDKYEYSEVNWVFPDKYDKVRVMEGTEEGFMGILIGIEDNIGIIRNDNGDIKKIQANFLTRRD